MSHVDGPRVPPVPEREWDDEVRPLLELTQAGGVGAQAANIFHTLANHPKLLKSWMGFGSHIIYSGVLPARERELLILRTGWNCRSDYEWGQHVLMGREAGLTDEEIDRVALGPEAPGWDPFESTLLTAADELHLGFELSDATWAKLSGRYDTRQLIETVFTVGQYHMVAMALNTLRVERDEGIPGLPSG
jgi:4-carboxymuconolactone decarboxylase